MVAQGGRWVCAASHNEFVQRKMSKSCTADVFLYEPTIGVVGHVLVDVKLMIRFSLCKYGLQKFGGKRTTSSGGRSLTQRHSGAF